MECLHFGGEDHHHIADNHTSFHYQCVFALNTEQQPLLSSIVSIFKTSKQSAVVAGLRDKCWRNLGMMESLVMKRLHSNYEVEKKELEKSHPEFRREDRLPAGEYKKYQTIKSEVYRYF